MRLPVAAKIALHTAGAAGGRPGSPKPVGGGETLVGGQVGRQVFAVVVVVDEGRQGQQADQ